MQVPRPFNLPGRARGRKLRRRPYAGIAVCNLRCSSARESLRLPASAHARHFHAEQFAELANFLRDVADADRAMMRRAVRIPVVHKFPRAG